jgi:hypothetical protein
VIPNPNNGKFWLVYEFNTTTSSVVDFINTDGITVWRNDDFDQLVATALFEQNRLFWDFPLKTRLI